MSGHKRALVSISQEEYHRLYDLEARLRHVQHDLPPAVTDLTQFAKELLEDSACQLASTWNVFEQQQDTWRNQVENDYSATIAQLVEIASNREANLENDFAGAIQQIETAAAEALNRQASAYDAALGIITEQKSREDVIAEVASRWINDAQRMLEHSADSLPAHQAAEFHQTLALARQNLADGLGSAALSLAQQTLLTVGHAVEKRRRDLLRDAARCAEIKTRWFEFLHTIQENATIEIGNPDQASEGSLIELDRWSSRHYTELLMTVQSELDRLEPLQTLTRPEGEIWGAKLTELESRFSKIIEEARQAVITAQRQVTLAAELLQSFDSQGFQFKQVIHSAEQPGDSLRILLADETQTEITLSILPVLDARSFQLDLLTHFPKLLSETDAEVRLDDLAQALFGQSSGYQVKSAEVLPDQGSQQQTISGTKLDV